MKKFESWKKENEENRKFILYVTMFFGFLGAILIKIDWPIIGGICIILAAFCFWIRSDTKIDESSYQKELEEEKAIKAEKAKERAEQKKADEKKAKKELAATKRVDDNFDVIKSNLEKLISIDCPKPTEFKKNLNEFEKEIVSKGSAEYLHKFVKVSSFLNDLWQHLTDTRQGMYDEVNIDRLKSDYKNKKESEKNRSLEDITRELQRKADGDFKDYSADGLIRRLKNTSQDALTVFPREFAQVKYLEAMANSMLIFLLEDKQIYFFEILESFDKLGALDSSWQKKLSQKMSSIESKLDILISGVSNLNDNLKVLIDKGDEISMQLDGIGSAISTNNILQAITAYQVYKINKNTKSLGN